MTRRALPPVMGLLLALTVSATPPPAKPSFAARADQIVGIVRAHFFDSTAAAAWARREAGYGARATDERRFAALTRRALDALGTSHTGYYSPDMPAFYALRSIFGPALGLEETRYDSAGIDVTPDGHVRVVFAGGPAAKAGLRRGDRIRTADGTPFDPVASFRGRAGSPVALRVERRPGTFVSLHVTPRRIEPKEEWLEAQRAGARVVERSGRPIGYVPMYACTGEDFAELLRTQFSDTLATADALVLDFRNGWGGCNPEFVSLFDPHVPAVTMTHREGTVRTVRTWSKPLVLLVNGGTRSGKEVVTYAVKKHRLGTVIGTKTAGAVLPGRCFKLMDGSLLLVPTSNVSLDGERLEGRGVVPDVIVDDALPFANGADPQLEAALDLAVRGRS